jgi:hypothetical protein
MFLGVFRRQSVDDGQLSTGAQCGTQPLQQSPVDLLAEEVADIGEQDDVVGRRWQVNGEHVARSKLELPDATRCLNGLAGRGQHVRQIKRGHPGRRITQRNSNTPWRGPRTDIEHVALYGSEDLGGMPGCSGRQPRQRRHNRGVEIGCTLGGICRHKGLPGPHDLVDARPSGRDGGEAPRRRSGDVPTVGSALEHP